ncbi:MAG: hypothetical protein WDO74_11790 [Pseudomonadota bacterium]
MPPHDASTRERDAWSRLRRFVDQTNGSDDGRDRPGLASCKRAAITPATATAYDNDDDDGPITTRWAVG